MLISDVQHIGETVRCNQSATYAFPLNQQISHDSGGMSNDVIYITKINIRSSED
tara:strand:+ start:5120 stop:5281 length:162 start_codon:yes stop_codon:yes gene_type:complete